MLALAASSLNAASVGNSVTEFSGVQGQDNWYYGYWAGAGSGYLPADFIQMDISDWTGTIWDYGPGSNFLTITSTSWHPNGGSGTGAIQTPFRRWLAEGTGDLTISGQWRNNDTLRATNATTRNGTTARIYVEGSVVYTQKIAWTAYPAYTAYTLTIPVTLGDSVDFSVHYDGDVNDDMTYFTAELDLVLAPEPVTTPEPATWTILALGLSALVWRGTNRSTRP